ncbi:SLC13 family permease [Geobacter sulfurreducens]|uniref:Transporter, putative n=1 Tax=Geobacter sulfurreducens (strain ATCC 51573 / DSM 12127 / PCA) TaxID=243231 RepID=Q74EW5_GEOSL|nr:SLC13 family permease [Geobacter sulfurreducens]AAR34174.1 transporter, putative [Geobacter sulfurreducens PCA]ADI83686.1 transporter, putative [Geobacter sulfurreducens KN400]QVW36090.1 SLC13 family permease [Geobacter sulfurreducens]UAC04904.1 SLC13 family permease [Geobacter sulfurreducens]UTG93531.1 SLC13 family permease [Geobacter sulfurreducens]
MIVTVTILALASLLFISGIIRPDLVAVSALILLMLFGILTPDEALSGFSSPIVMMMIGLFVVGGGIFQTGLAKQVSRRLLKLAGTNETTLLIMVMVVTAAFGTTVSNTGTVAVLMPIVVSLATSARINPGRLLMPLAFASSFGGTLTLIGTPPNLVIQETLVSAGYGKLSFFSFTPIGLVGFMVGLVSLLFLRRFLPRNETGKKTRSGRSPGELARKYQLSDNLFRAKVGATSSVASRTLSELNISARFEVNIIEIRRKTSARNQFLKTIDQEIAGPATVLEEGDILYIHGTFDQVRRVTKEYGLILLDHQVPEDRQPAGAEQYATAKIGIAEVMLTPGSNLIGKLVEQSGFREKYRVNILGIQRKDRLLLHNLKGEKMLFGDALLVQGTWKDIALLSAEQADYVVIGQPAEESRRVTMDNKAPIAAGIMLLMVVLLVTELIPAVVSVMIAAVLMVLLGCVRTMEDAYKTINWESIILIGGMLPMSTAIAKTGAAELLSNSLASSLGSYGPVVLLAGVYVTTSVLTLFISNTACAVLLAPIALNAAAQLGVSPYPFMFAVSIGASMCFASPFSTPPNALVMSAGRYTFGDYIKVGLPLQVVMGIVMVLVLPLFFPF